MRWCAVSESYFREIGRNEGGRRRRRKKLFEQKLIKTDPHRGGAFSLIDKTDDPDDPDPGRQAGAFLATNSWKRLLQLRLPGQVRAVSGLGQEKRAGFGCQERIP